MASAEQLAALKAVVPAAQQSAQVYGVPASITLAQWIVESSWGTSKLAILANNFFGVKALQPNTPDTYEEFQTAEFENGKRVIVAALFEKYPSPAMSFDGHARLLAIAARYKPAMAVAHIPTAFAMALQKCGYSTSPTYGTGLCELMREYNLTQYDNQPPAAAQEVAA